MRLPFTLDPQVIHHIIHAQAGSIGKALIELVMNSVDARANALTLTVSAQGFVACDDGQGFAAREDVVRYFGRFGTPHEEGDATFGRFRLGRGQIMAHAATVWRSQAWLMRVDTRAMGYAYDLEDLPASDTVSGCRIEGAWYETLSPMDLHEVIQELHDLIRYTPLAVTLNGRPITRDPRAEAWTYEDEWAYYRVRREGSMALYNQGVLVRHDPGHLWGAGGIVVSKRAIGLNVSRTEILRKTCPVWARIAGQTQRLAKAFEDAPSTRLDENARTSMARQLCTLEGCDLLALVHRAAVFTVLPGRRHVGLQKLLSLPSTTISAVPWMGAVAAGERLALAKAATVLHPSTLQRFGCEDLGEFEVLWNGLRQRLVAAGDPTTRWLRRVMAERSFIELTVLDRRFPDSTEVVEDRALTPEVRRAWGAMRSSLHRYARQVLLNSDHPTAMASLVFVAGRSPSADAWTDGRSYIAVNERLIKALPGEGLAAAHRIFAVVDHELAHEGDSLDAAHDEAFFNRYHDISLGFAALKQRCLHRWVANYALVLGRASKSGAVRRHLTQTGRVMALEGERSAFAPAEPDLNEPPPAPSPAAVAQLNAALGRPGAGWDGEAVREAVAESQALREQARAERARWEAEEALWAQEQGGEDQEDDGEEPERSHAPENDEPSPVVRGAGWAVYDEPVHGEALEALAREAGALLGRPVTAEEQARIVRMPLRVAFLAQTGRWPVCEKEPADELWCWLLDDRPALEPHETALALHRRARNVGLKVADYVAQRGDLAPCLPDPA